MRAGFRISQLPVPPVCRVFVQYRPAAVRLRETSQMMRNKVFDAAGGFVTLDVRAFLYPPANDLRLGWSDFHGAVAYLIRDARDRPVLADLSR